MGRLQKVMKTVSALSWGARWVLRDGIPSRSARPAAF
jgi:hypothetical protein